MFKKEQSRSLLEDKQWWDWLNHSAQTHESTRYAFSLFLQTFSAPTVELRLQALEQVLHVGVPVGMLAEEAILNDTPEILKALKSKTHQAWKTWSREMPFKIDGSFVSESMENYQFSIQDTPLVIQWLLEYACFKKEDSKCLEMILGDKKDKWDPIKPMSAMHHGRWLKRSVVPTQESWTPLAYAIFHGNFKLANLLLRDKRVSQDQQSLDEALFALYQPNTLRSEGVSLKNALTLRLLQLGANSSRSFECHFAHKTSQNTSTETLSEEDWVWHTCAGSLITKTCLIEDPENSVFKDFVSFIAPEKWPAPTGPEKDYWQSSLNQAFSNLENTHYSPKTTLNFDALTALARAPFAYAHENFIGETLLSLLNPKLGESKEEKIKALQSLHDKIGQAQFYTNDTIWDEILKRITPSSSEMLNWAKTMTQENPSLQSISFHWNPKNLKKMMDIDWSNILSSDESVLFKEIKTQFHESVEPILNSTSHESQEKVQLFLSTLPVDRSLPKPKSLRI